MSNRIHVQQQQQYQLQQNLIPIIIISQQSNIQQLYQQQQLVTLNIPGIQNDIIDLTSPPPIPVPE